MRQPDFENILKVCRKEQPSRPTLFEFFLNDSLISTVTSMKIPSFSDIKERIKFHIKGFEKLGYDYVTVLMIRGNDDFLPKKEKHLEKTISLNEYPTITNRKDFEEYSWKAEWDTQSVKESAKNLPPGMKFIVYSPNGLLENVIGLTGFDNLCYMLADDPSLVQDLFDRVGTILYNYYKEACSIPQVGACIVNDDWGFKSQTMISPSSMRQYIFPWYKKIVNLIHQTNRPVILHSCGNLSSVMEDIFDTGFDAKHSYEDTILPVEDAYEKYHDRIAILGGIDVDFLIRSDNENIINRCKKMFERVKERGGYALGSGNSIPDYVPHDKYFAMINSWLNL